MKSLAYLASVLAPSAVFAAEPVPPSLFHCVDPNLEVTVWAQSPDFFNPTNMDIDAQGRVWVAEGVNYRSHANRKPEGDRIMVLQDTDGDGKADKSWPFVQEPFLRAPLGVAVIGNKVVVSMAPDLVVYTDKDGDAKFDASKGDTREVLLSGFAGRNHDHALHSVTVGPDGKWYFSAGNCGAQFTDKSGKTFRIGSKQNTSWWPKDPAFPNLDPNDWAGQKSDDGKVYVGGFIARMNPDGTNVEILAHNLRNSYENCVTSYGDVFASDNDDQPACRVFGILEGGNYGFASADGERPWQADRRPGQTIPTATWRQDDPGVAPAGDIYGGGAPTGCAFYENGALGAQHEGTLLVCESARNTIFGYKPQRQGAGWKLERFDFLTTNKEGKVVGTDYTGGNGTAKADDTKTLFRPSDVAVGPDGAIYIADWYDARVGGHADLDDSVSGTIYRVAPKDFKSVVPKIDLNTVEGAIAAMNNPAVNVRALGSEAARRFSKEPKASDNAKAMEAKNKWHFARALAVAAVKPKTAPKTLEEKLAALDITDKAALASFALQAHGETGTQLAAKVLTEAGSINPIEWTPKTAAVLWLLHPPQAVSGFKTRALATTLSEKARREAVTAIGFNSNKEAAEAMLEIAAKADGAVKQDAVWWALNRKDSTWKDHGVAAALKERGVYDPEKVAVVAVEMPEPPAPSFTLEDAMKLTGDVKRGELASQRCLMCHRISDQGADFGPDMTTWGKTQPTEVLLRSMIDPSADIAHGFHGNEVKLKDGGIIHGMIITDGDPLIITSMGGNTQMIPKDRIKSKKGLHRSLMMSATQLGLTAQDTADIAAYLKAR